MQSAAAVSSQTSPARSVYRLRLTETNLNLSIRDPRAIDSSTNLPPTSSRHPPPSPAPNKISAKLLLIVTKFEALDALSLPLKSIPKPQASPKMSPRLRKHGAVPGAGRFRRLSTIFSPSRSSEAIDDPFYSANNPAPKGNNLFSPDLVPEHLFGKVGSQKWDNIQGTNHENTIRRWESIVKPLNPSPLSITAPYVKNAIPPRAKRSIQDMVKIYDGAFSGGLFAKENASMGSLITNTPTPISRRKRAGSRHHLSPSTGNSRHRPSTWNSRALDSPTKISRPYSHRSLRRGPTADRQMVDNGLPRNSSLSSVKVRARSFDLVEQERGQEISKFHALEQDKQKLPSHIPHGGLAEKISTELLAQFRGSSTFKRDMSETVDRRRTSSKIEGLYRAKSMEWKLGSGQILDPKMSALTATPSRLFIESADSNSGKFLRKKSSKVAAMTKLFDSGVSPQRADSMMYTPTSKHNISASSLVVNTLADDHAARQEQGTAVIEQAARVPPTTIPGLREAAAKECSPAKSQMEILSQPVPARKPAPPRGEGINEKVRIFEGGLDGVATLPNRCRGSFVRKLSRSLKNLFESHTVRRRIEEKQARERRGLLGRELQDIVDEFQDTGKSKKPEKKRSTIIGRWNPLPSTSISRGGDATADEEGIIFESSVDVREMIVKEAECGLRQPKPVRVVEVKRMMLLCKERFGDRMDRERVQTRRV